MVSLQSAPNDLIRVCRRPRNDLGGATNNQRCRRPQLFLSMIPSWCLATQLMLLCQILPPYILYRFVDRELDRSVTVPQ